MCSIPEFYEITKSFSMRVSKITFSPPEGVFINTENASFTSYLIETFEIFREEDIERRSAYKFLNTCFPIWLNKEEGIYL